MNKLIVTKGVEIINKLLNKKITLSIIIVIVVCLLGMPSSVKAEEGAGGNKVGVEFYLEKTNPPKPKPKPDPKPTPKPQPKPGIKLPQTSSTYSLTIALVGGLIVLGVGVISYRKKQVEANSSC